MPRLPFINEQEFNTWFRHFLEYGNHTYEADIVFIDLFQQDSKYSRPDLLSERIATYISADRKRKKLVGRSLECLLNFLCDYGYLTRSECAREKNRIAALLSHSKSM